MLGGRRRGYTCLVTNQDTLRLEAGTDCCWVLAGSNACNYALVNEYLGYLVDRNYSPRTVRAYGYDLLAFCRWLDGEGIALDAVTTDVVLNFMHFCRQVAIKDRPANVVSMSGRRLDGYAATTINHRLAALAGLFTFRSMRDPEVRNPIPSGREARRVSAAERNGLLGHLVRPKRRSALRLREPRRLPRSLDRRETTDLLDSLRTWRDRALAGLMLLSGLRSGELLTLDVADVDIGARWLRVMGKGSKERRVPLDVDVAGLSKRICLSNARRRAVLDCSWSPRARTGVNHSPLRACVPFSVITAPRRGCLPGIRTHCGTPSALRWPRLGWTWR